MCDNIPIRTILATTDDSLYLESQHKWSWNGELFVGIGCGENYPNNFKQLSVSPFTWSYCNVNGCSRSTGLLKVVFTFNPESENKNDFLEYIIDIPSSRVVVRPDNTIKDKSGTVLDFDIESVDRHGAGSDSLLEIWLGKGSSRGSFLPELRKQTLNWKLLLEKIGLGLIISFAVVLAVLLIKRFQQK